MSRVECPREQEVLDALASNRWPHHLSADLAAHVEGCAFCKDLGLVAETLHADFAAAIDQATVPTAGLVWWRAQIRARQESLVAVNRPITIAHYIGLALAAAAIVALLVLADFSISELIPDSIPVSSIVAIVGGFIAFASVALYFVFSDR
jgi:hypothetical protein